MSRPKNLVVILQPNKVEVQHLTRRARKDLESRGFRCLGEQVVVGGEDEMLDVARILVSHEALFSGGAHGWPPSAVLRLAREEGKFELAFREAVWLGPGKMFVYDHV